jgi:hypothetical protein
MMVEDIVNMPVYVIISSKNVPHKHQLCMQAVFIPESFSLMHQCGKNSFSVGWELMDPALT